MSFQVGQRVIVLDRRWGGTRRYEGTVTKVGRKWATVKGDLYSEWQVDKETGWLKPEGGYSSSGAAYTPEGLLAKEEHDVVVKEVAELTRSYSWADRLSTDQLRRVVAILREGER